MRSFVLALGLVVALSSAALAEQKSPWLPDPDRTPGATNPDITQANIHKTICNRGHWSTKSIRPPVSYTNRLKKKQIGEYGYEDTDPHSFEEDHDIPLTLGGHPTSPKNLWPQKWSGEWGARVKDKIEVLANKLVCTGELTLAEAQCEISSDWVQMYRKRVLGDKTVGRIGHCGEGSQSLSLGPSLP